MSAHEQERNSSAKATIKTKKMDLLCPKREKPKKQQAGSGKAAEKQKAAGRTDKRAKAKLKV